ncbi:hypothetical protein K438DRAFT_1965412 [Mycena galopus ATCC 62051]|nr:hypothetical protein K438DRAFT_1965412 [Mycena galopus ATCC 62051]
MPRSEETRPTACSPQEPQVAESSEAGCESFYLQSDLDLDAAGHDKDPGSTIQQTSSPMACKDSDTVKPGCIRFYLFSNDEFYLEIPLAQISENCLHPVKYLKYLGFAILGVFGDVSLRSRSRKRALSIQSNLTQGTEYQFLHGGEVTKSPVDLRLVVANVPSVLNHLGGQKRDGRFKQRLEIRDGQRCVFTGSPLNHGHHIIPICKGDSGLKDIRDTRVVSGQHGADVTSIQDPRNGLLVCADIHSMLASQMAILPTPNPVLATTDIPQSPARMLSGSSYPPGARFTLQFLERTPKATAAESVYVAGWHGHDAAFAQAVPTGSNYTPADDDQNNGSYDPQGPFNHPSEFLLTYA